MQIAILFPAIWFAAHYSITAVAAAQVAEKTVSLALLGVIIGRILGIPWYATFAAGAPALGAVGADGRRPLPARHGTLPPGAALAVGIPLGARSSTWRCCGAWCRTASGCSCARCVDLRRRITVPAGTVAAARRRRSCWPGAAAPRPPRPAASAAAIASPRHPPHLLRGPGRVATRARAPGERPFGTLAHALKQAARRHSASTSAAAPTDERVKLTRRAGRPDARVLVTNFPGERPVVQRPALDRRPELLDDPRDQRHVGGRQPRRAAGAHLRRHRLGAHRRSEIWGSHSTSGLHDRRRPAQQPRALGREGQLHPRHATPPTASNQDHNVYVDDMSASPSPRGVISQQHPLQRGERPRHQARAGGTDGGAVNVTVRFNTIYNSSQNVGVSRDSSGVRHRAQHPGQGAARPTSRRSSCTAATTSRATTSAPTRPTFLANTGGRRPPRRRRRQPARRQHRVRLDRLPRLSLRPDRSTGRMDDRAHAGLRDRDRQVGRARRACPPRTTS